MSVAFLRENAFERAGTMGAFHILEMHLLPFPPVLTRTPGAQCLNGSSPNAAERRNNNS